MIDKSKGQTDRILTQYDEDQRVLYLRDFNLVAPDVGISEEPVRCYVINEQWAKIVFGFLSWLAEPAVWKDAQYDDFPAILEILEFLGAVLVCRLNCVKIHLINVF